MLKLKVEGPSLGFPHQSAVQSPERAQLRELRPRGGRSRWRLLYRRIGLRTFTILAVAPEAQMDGSGFREAVRKAHQRLDELNDPSG